MTKGHVLIVDDEASVRFAIEEALFEGGFEITSAPNAADALAMLGVGGGKTEIDAVLTDLVMPGTDGLALTMRVKEVDPDLPVILLTARGSERTAVQAMKAGAHDYLTKPFGVEELRLVVERAIEAHRLRRSARVLVLERAVGNAIAGESAAWRSVMNQARKAGRRNVTVLVRGETGTGKEIVAAALHAESPRRDGPFVRFNCGAIPADLAEAELFGHVRGAFTGATADKRGFFAQADGGTLVLDEIGELPINVQASLLRVLQEGEIQRVGAGKVEKVDVRVVACTHRDLRAEIAQGRFREDLYYRLAVIEIEIPPLRDRRDDIPSLIEVLRKRWIARFAMDDVRFDAPLIDALICRDWPGNVRELENVITRVLTMSDGDVVGIDALGVTTPIATTASDTTTLRAQVDTFEKQLVTRVLLECKSNQSEAARRLGVTRTTLLDKLKRYGVR